MRHASSTLRHLLMHGVALAVRLEQSVLWPSQQRCALLQPQHELAGLIAANPATDRQRAIIEEAKSDPSKRPMGGGVSPALGMPGGGGYCTA